MVFIALYTLLTSNQSHFLGFSLQKTLSFVECMLGLDTERLGDLIGTSLLEKVVDLLTELDVWSPFFLYDLGIYLETSSLSY